MSRCLLALACIVSLAGCGGVVSEDPASDESTSQVDARLIGFWRVEWDAQTPADPSVRDLVFVVGRAKESEHELAAVAVELNDGVLEVEHLRARATTIDGRSYLSASSVPTSRTRRPAWTGWALLRYDAPDEASLRLLTMDEHAVASDVRAKRVAGTVKEDPRPNGEPLVSVTLMTATPMLRDYLASRGDEIYRADRPLTLRRLRLP